ncbi:hypothetical protein AKJ39_03885 [candidate division MSBL1 archaeon SCGC-AAA259J03]|uniref:Uncharacterized protein n=1 Tax=candidate division MSBL1 archaeon SCGC-AAA259J03 TaxID=1698269 RepID=A0A656YVF5_9EURY|nr:hypothetical protein AKJ39_03885 [candidate division MSBL1 archaeon SCGC-AAA259J03]
MKSSPQETLLAKTETKTTIRQLKDKSENGKGYFYTYTKKTYIPIIYGGGSLTPPSFGIGIGIKRKDKRNLGDVPEWRKVEFEKVAKNRRLIQPFGNFFGIVFENPEPFKCPKCGCTEWIFFIIRDINSFRKQEET